MKISKIQTIIEIAPVSRIKIRLKMRLGQMDPRLACSGPMSTFSYDSHPVSR